MKLINDSFAHQIKNLNSQYNHQSPLILTVDDNRDNLLLINLALSYFNYKLVITANTQTAMSMVKRDLPNLILLGINTPGTKEQELLRQLKQDHKTRSIPIVALTALVNPDYLSSLLDLGCDYCLSKPYLLEELQRVIRDRYAHSVA